MRVLSCLMVALCLGATAARADGFDDACAYFHARSASGTGNTVFRQHLAEQCGVALLSYKAAPPGTEAHDMAKAFLVAIRDFRGVLEAIPRDRLARTMPPEMVREAPAMLRRPVSASGEVLIARVIGVTPRLSEWESWRLSQR